MPQLLLVARSHQRVEAVGADHQVHVAQLAERADGVLELRLDPHRASPLLQQLQQREPADRGEADSVDADGLAAVHERDVAPVLHGRRDEIVGVGIVAAQELEGLLGEHDAEAPGGALGVLLVEAHVVPGVALLPERGEVQAGGAAADDRDPHRADSSRQRCGR